MKKNGYALTKDKL